MKAREKVISDYFQAWIKKDVSVLENVFAPNAVYIESWGPAYRSRADIVQWFIDWSKQNNVLQWDIKLFLHEGKTCVCEWYFECECKGKVDEFNGVSIIDFDDDDKVVMLKEFQSKVPNVYPYE